MQLDTVGELLEVLEQFPEDTEIRVAFQPQWPLAGELTGIHIPVAEDPHKPHVIWLAVSQTEYEDTGPYAPREAWEHD